MELTRKVIWVLVFYSLSPLLGRIASRDGEIIPLPAVWIREKLVLNAIIA
jgi:hypothetical protein